MFRPLLTALFLECFARGAGSLCPAGYSPWNSAPPAPALSFSCPSYQVARETTAFHYAGGLEWFNSSDAISIYVQLWGGGATGGPTLTPGSVFGGGGAYISGWLSSTYVNKPVRVLVGGDESSSLSSSYFKKKKSEKRFFTRD